MALQNTDPTRIFEGNRIVFRNFAGKEGQYNREGDRNFALLLNDGVETDLMIQEGWNVKFLKPREEGDIPQPYLPVSVNFRGPRPPRVVIITSRGRTTLDESMVEMLDYADIANIDVIVRPYDWNVNGNTGRKAYLQSLFVTIQEDFLELKYADVPEIGSGPAAIEAADGEVIDVEFWDGPTEIEAGA